jgi:hypothetical protein
METRADLEQRSIAAQCRKEWRVTGSGFEEVGGLFFQNILSDFVQDLREGYR